MTRVDYRLNAIIDSTLASRGDLAEMAAITAANGATIVQYRDKHAPTWAMVGQAIAIRDALAGSGVPFIVNDRVDVALAAGADGVHLGRDDVAPSIARRLMGEGAIIGVTVKSSADAERAVSSAVDYACIGGVFETLSKDNPDPPLGLAGFARLRRQIFEERPDLPVGAIAGIDAARAGDVVRAGASGVAVISAIFGADDIAAATRALREAVDRALQGEEA